MVNGYPDSVGFNRTGQTAGASVFSGVMQNSRGALTPLARLGAHKPCPARLALIHRRQPSRIGSGQPYMITTLFEERSM